MTGGQVGEVGADCRVRLDWGAALHGGGEIFLDGVRNPPIYPSRKENEACKLNLQKCGTAAKAEGRGGEEKGKVEKQGTLRKVETGEEKGRRGEEEPYEVRRATRRRTAIMANIQR